MVEGPGCKQKGEVMLKILKGKRIIRVQTDGDNQACTTVPPQPTCMDKLVGKTLLDVKTLGKELFAIFEDDVCLRLHFQMNGSIRYNNFGKAKLGKPCLSIELTQVMVEIFETNFQIRPASECYGKYERMKMYDVCSTSFHHGQTLKLLSEASSSRLIADVLMDQDILPGVGNIIKNEALFNSGINPNTLLKDLNKGHLSKLLKETKDFSRIFYEIRRKRGGNLQPHLRVYNKKTCSRCNHKLTRCKPGVLKRLTFFCRICQTNLPRTLMSSANLTSPMTRSCTNCTSKNSGEASGCIACESHSGSQQRRCSQPLASIETCPVCRTPFSENGGICSVCQTSRNKSSLCERLTTPSISENLPSVSSTNTEIIGVNPTSLSTVRVPLCTGHRHPCEEKQVRKEGPTRGRLFYACASRGPSRCNYFQWADLHFPKCKHNVLTCRRQVLKQNENNGREFYVCSKRQGEQCDFFQWTD